jgi:hypothetical protein
MDKGGIRIHARCSSPMLAPVRLEVRRCPRWFDGFDLNSSNRGPGRRNL